MDSDHISKQKSIESAKKEMKSAEVESLGAKFYDHFKSTNKNNFNINTDLIINQLNNFIGLFLHGLKLKSYNFL